MRLATTLLSLIVPLGIIAHPPHGEGHAARHHHIAKRASGDVELHKRFSSARWTFYDVGLGACGITNGPSDYIVALNSAQFGGGYPGPNCFKTITMTYNGKTKQATITDECPGCPYGGLDLSRGLFSFFASEDAGVIYGEWSFNDGSGQAPAQPKTTKKTTTWKPEPTTTQKTTTWKPDPTTTSKPDPTTTTTTHKPETTSDNPKSTSSTSTSSSSSSKVESTSTSTLSESKTSVVPTPTPSVVQQTLSNLQTLNNVFYALGSIAVAGVAV